MSLEPRHRFFFADKYDGQRGYVAAHCYATRVYDRPIGNRLDDLGLNGFEVVPAMDPEKAMLLSGKALQAADIGPKQLRDVLTQTLTPTLDQKIRDYFCSYYTVLFWNVHDSSNDNVSLKWHCDAGPTTYLKILVYLNDGHSGATDVLDQRTSDLFKRIGYGFAPFTYRVDDITQLGREHGIDARPQRLRPKAGEAIVFCPSQVLHRGVYPKDGTTRWVMQIGVIPWADPWNESFEHMWLTIEANEGAGFPEIIPQEAA